MKLNLAVKTLCKSLREDPDLYQGYQSNIAMAFKDEYARQGSRDSRTKIHEIANKASKNFLDMLISPTR